MSVFLSEIVSAAAPAIVSFLGTILTVGLTRAANVARSRWGIEIEARHREALHAALMSGIQAALLGGLTGEKAIKAAVQHAGISVPDALKALKPAPVVLASIAEAKLREATGPDAIGRIVGGLTGAAR